MGSKDGYHWDNAKSELLKRVRKYSLEEIVDRVFLSGLEYMIRENRAYPGQFKVISVIDDRVLVIICEDINDGFGYFTRLFTYWDAERKDMADYKRARDGKR